MITLVLGPVRAGKSARAVALARASGKRVVVAATLAVDPNDTEMLERIERHRRDRPPEWELVETGMPRGPRLADVLRGAEPQTCIVIDALGTWLAAHLVSREEAAEREPIATLSALDACGAALADALARTRADVIVVAEEAGWGVVPPTALGRIFRDALGRLTQRIAEQADRVELVVAGYTIDVRAVGKPIDEV